MIPVNIEMHDFVPPDTTKVIWAVDQDPYLPLPSLVTPDGQVCSRWKLGPNEIELIKNGVDVYLTVFTFNRGLPPCRLTVGQQDLRECDK